MDNELHEKKELDYLPPLFSPPPKTNRFYSFDEQIFIEYQGRNCGKQSHSYNSGLTMV